MTICIYAESLSGAHYLTPQNKIYQLRTRPVVVGDRTGVAAFQKNPKIEINHLPSKCVRDEMSARRHGNGAYGDMCHRGLFP